MKLRSQLPAVGTALHLVPILATAFILIIYAYLSTSMVAPSGVTVETPESTSGLSGFHDAHVVTLAVGEAEPLYFNGKRLTLTELAVVLDKQPQDKRQAILYADRNVSYGRVTQVSSVLLQRRYQLAHATTPPPVAVQQ
jgi:biopolymer transport protein ExbD